MKTMNDGQLESTLPKPRFLAAPQPRHSSPVTRHFPSRIGMTNAIIKLHAATRRKLHALHLSAGILPEAQRSGRNLGDPTARPTTKTAPSPRLYRQISKSADLTHLTQLTQLTTLQSYESRFT